MLRTEKISSGKRIARTSEGLWGLIPGSPEEIRKINRKKREAIAEQRNTLLTGQEHPFCPLMNVRRAQLRTQSNPSSAV